MEKEKNMEKSLIIGDKQNKRIEIYDDELRLPQELIIENILTRLPARILAVFSCVSKLWCNLISNDKRFAAAHFLQNKNKSNLVFNFFNVFKNNCENAYFFTLHKGSSSDEDEFLDYKPLMSLSLGGIIELVGYCNGLACVKPVSIPGDVKGVLKVINPNRGETLTLYFFTPSGCRFLCHGFGFDSSSQAYKAVLVYTSKDNDEFICTVITLGTNSWRTIVTRAADMSPPPGYSLLPGRMVTRPSRISQREATLCGGDLFWKLTAHDNNTNDKIEMLLSFDIHDETIRFIGLPTGCTTLSPMNEHDQYVEVDHHLLEFQGYTCVARCEKIMMNNRYRPLRSHQCDSQIKFCRCRFEVHMYILKDKLRQVWFKVETFNAQLKEEEGLLPPPFCCYYGSTTPTATATPPTRMLSFSDQVLLYWFDGKCLLLYNLRMKHLKVVRCSSSCIDQQYRSVFEHKMKGIIAPGRNIGHDDHICFPYIHGLSAACSKGKHPFSENLHS